MSHGKVRSKLRRIQQTYKFIQFDDKIREGNVFSHVCLSFYSQTEMGPPTMPTLSTPTVQGPCHGPSPRSVQGPDHGPSPTLYRPLTLIPHLMYRATPHWTCSTWTSLSSPRPQTSGYSVWMTGEYSCFYAVASHLTGVRQWYAIKWLLFILLIFEGQPSSTFSHIC